MRIVLAGYNLDKDVIDSLSQASPGRHDITPETLSAAYARISRDPRPVDELRRAAREEVEKARRSNRAIIFRMGHHSVAEHAVFNFDIVGVSRLAIEAIERFRLSSYTEKSQRYILLGSDFVVPEEVRAAGQERLFLSTVRAQNKLYHTLYRKLRPRVLSLHADLAAEPKNRALLEGWAMEDARYAVSLATEGQLGLTANARTLELMIRRFAASESAEVREIGRRLYGLAKEVAPSIVLFTEPGELDAHAYRDLQAAAALLPARRSRRSEAAVSVVDRDEDGDDRVLAALLHTVTRRSAAECRATIGGLSLDEKRGLMKTALARMEFFDTPPREFEYAGLTFELVLSASCFAQLKRHRLVTLTGQDYDPAFGATVPPSVEAVGAGGIFRETLERTNEAYGKLRIRSGRAAAYVLMNAHRRRVLLRTNLRELYHISRLREDSTAQWEIREIAAAMSAAARRAMPLAGMLLGGKDVYPALYRKIFGRAPRAVPPAVLK
jgi:flavin-dependent thymidylate synthase